ncbi:MAG TPA: flagellar export chaperone FliS [Rugosimonospora sp.]|nr:flagellar export chaperone FliS [Rugosimonospora sp.]
MTTPSPRSRYLADSVSTASPARLLLMLYDRMILDLVHAEEALRTGDRSTANTRLLSAQAIIVELRASLDLTVWTGAAGLASLYGYLLTELIRANVHGDADRTATCRLLLEPLRDAWREAALSEAVVAPAKSV